MNVILIGLRGSGKSTVGRLLAKALERDFVDCDELIETKTELTIAEIIGNAGEPHFRSLESQVIEELGRSNSKVVATGGGAVLRRRNVVNLKQNGIIFFLDIEPEAAWKRISSDPKSASQRPALTGRGGLEELEEQSDQRRPYYLSAADHVIDANDRVEDQVLNEILEILRRTPGAEPEY